MQAMRGTHNSEINVTPFLDVLLVLLVIFMATVQAQRVMWAQSPAPSDQECAGSCETIVLEVLPRGAFLLNKVYVGREDLRARLRGAFAGRPTSVLFIAGDPAATYQEVVTAFDEARGAGVQVLAIAPGTVR
jgi:biopolymer transport protein ExbD